MKKDLIIQSPYLCMVVADTGCKLFPKASSANMMFWRAWRCHICTELLRSLCIFVSSSAALAVLSSKSLTVLTESPVPPVRTLIRNAVKGEGSELVPHHSCDPLPLLLPTGIALWLYQAGVCRHSFIHSTNTHQMLFYASHGSSLWGHSEKKGKQVSRLIRLLFSRGNKC